MADTNTFDQGSKILQNVDVSSIVTGLALGIAEAQERLDNNSVSQLIRLADTQVAGKSLLEFGFQPAFYAFDYADISASISLKMAIKEEVEVDFSLSVDYRNNTTFDKDFFDQLKKNKQNSKSKNSKTQKTVALKAKTSKNVSVNETSFEIHKEEGSISKIRTAEEKMRDDQQDLRVETAIESETLTNEATTDVFIREHNGFVIVTPPFEHAKTTALLQMETTYSGTAVPIRIKGSGGSAVTFDKITDFGTTLADATTKNNTGAAVAGTVTGINNSGIHRGAAITPYAFYFDWDIDVIDYNYAHNQATPSLTLADIELLAFVLKESDLKITIKGYTDGSGPNDYNEPLSKSRALALKRELENFAGTTFPESKVATKGFGETLTNDDTKQADFRKVTIEFDASTLFDYIHFEGGQITVSGAIPKLPSTDPNVFVYIAATKTATNSDVKFTYGGVAYDLTTHLATLTTVNNYKSKLLEFYAEKHNESYYLLHEDATINYFIHSKDSKEVNVTIDNEASAEIDKDKTTVYVSETENDLSKLKQSSKDFEGDRSLAISGALDVRYARQFGMSVEGNASVSARMISVPPPTALENYIQSLSGNTNPTSGN